MNPEELQIQKELMEQEIKRRVEMMMEPRHAQLDRIRQEDQNLRFQFPEVQQGMPMPLPMNPLNQMNIQNQMQNQMQMNLQQQNRNRIASYNNQLGNTNTHLQDERRARARSYLEGFNQDQDKFNRNLGN